MMRKITFLFVLLFIGFQGITHAQAVRDSVSIYHRDPYRDTTCPGEDLVFYAVQTEDTFTAVSYHWYVSNIYSGVTIDTFHTSAAVDGDSVFCMLYFTNSFGFPDSQRSNAIIIHRSSAIGPRAVISLTTGSNPDCAGHPLTFTAYPVNGGSSPTYQWLINGVAIGGATSTTFTHTYGSADTVSVMMVSNSPCRTYDTAYSNTVPIIHIHLTAAVDITVSKNPICAGTKDTLDATLTNPGTTSYTVSWYVNGVLIPTAVGNRYITDSLHDGALVWALLRTTDSCITNDSVTSNVITMTVIPNNITNVSSTLIHGSNPGCIDSPVTFRGTFSNFGTLPTIEWYVNGVRVDSGDSIYTTTYLNGDLVTFRVNATDNGCYTNDTLASPAFLMIRDSIPATPLVSLIGNMLVSHAAGHYTWYYNTINSYVGASVIAGATSQTNHPTILGYYFATKDTGNCPSLPSNIIYISLLKVNDLGTVGDVKLYPNPSSGMLNIDWENGATNMSLDIYNVLGQPMKHEQITNQSHYETNISDLPSGNYFVVMHGEDGATATFKVVLAK